MPIIWSQIIVYPFAKEMTVPEKDAVEKLFEEGESRIAGAIILF